MRRRFAPHQLRHAHAVEMAREGVPLNVIQRQLGHANLRVSSIYLQGIDSAEIINAVHARVAPMMPATAGLRWSRCPCSRCPEVTSRRAELLLAWAARLSGGSAAIVGLGT